MKIYTKTGDQGQTALFDGTRVAKDDPRIDLYGTIDELNSNLGSAAACISDQDFKNKLHHVQSDLFALGAKLANPGEKKQKDKSNFAKNKIEWLESEIDALTQQLPPMTGFILPGGALAASQLHMARCICRRAERQLVHFNRAHSTDPVYLIYLNRLSDYLFCAARLANQLAGVKDVAWE